MREGGVIAAATIPMLTIAITDSFGTALGDTFVDVHQAGFLIGQGMIISINTVILGWLLLDAKVVPKALALLGLAGGVIVLTGNGLQLFGAVELGGAVAGLTAIPIFAFEIWFAFYLLIPGLRTSRDAGSARTESVTPPIHAEPDQAHQPEGT